ncbi:hypothetical protein BDV25DRAFT_143432 [Aspergillus avenaceus]|uniref:Uncharacterized protein n=1 Tax=Aspergillus avenaceus TaxID=36643 RepID=A0A5N6TK43_ASPAV|nr:hypothetical protein BDV25DRAFT_143432 [Aspergillus avenaceus]
MLIQKTIQVLTYSAIDIINLAIGLGLLGLFRHYSLGSDTRCHFSFWLGKNHVVGISGAAVCKIFLDNHDFDFVRGAALVGHGPDFVPPLHEIFYNNYQNGRSYFQRHLVDLQRSEQLAKRLPGVTRDARMAFEALGRNPRLPR